MAIQGRRSGKYRQATRLLKLLDLLRSRHFGATLEELAAEFGVSERQIRRDLEALDEAGYGTEPVPAADGRARVKLSFASTRSVSLSARERFGLLAVRRVFDVLEDTPLHEDVQSIYAKVAGSLSDEKRQSLEELGERFLFVPDGGVKPYGGKEEVLDGLLSGVIYRARVRYRYRSSSGEASRGVLEPYAMVLYKHGLYVIGRARPVGAEAGEQKPTVFAAERFAEARYLRGERFEVPADFKLDRFFHGAFGIFVGGTPVRVVVDFAAAVRSLVEARIWHRTQRFRRLPDGGVRLSFEVDNLTQVLPWALSWGPHATVREPKELVSDVERELRAALAHYGA